MKPKKATAQSATAAPTRRRNAEETKKAILQSARSAFARAGYDGVGVREIAKGAGVTGILINRYFGSKERLFSDVLASAMENPGILTPENLSVGPDDLSRRIATALVMTTKAGVEQRDGFLILLHSVSNERAAAIFRESIEQHYEKSLANRLSGKRTKERASLILSLIAGVHIMRRAVASNSLAEANQKWLIDVLTEMIQSLVTPD